LKIQLKKNQIRFQTFQNRIDTIKTQQQKQNFQLTKIRDQFHEKKNELIQFQQILQLIEVELRKTRNDIVVDFFKKQRRIVKFFDFFVFIDEKIEFQFDI